MRDFINKLKGHINITISKDGETKTVADRPNAIQAAAKQIIVRNIAGTNQPVDKIQAYKANALLAEKAVSVSYPATGKVKFSSLFLTTDFNDTVDEIRLISTPLGQMAKVTGLSITKDGTSEMVINWEITAN